MWVWMWVVGGCRGRAFLDFLIFLGFLGFLGEDLGILAVWVKLEKAVPTKDLGVLTGRSRIFRNWSSCPLYLSFLIIILEGLNSRKELFSNVLVELPFEQDIVPFLLGRR